MQLLNRRNLNVFFISLLLLLLPTQFGKHFFFDFSFVNGVRVDYLAPTLYVTDIIVFLLISTNIRVILEGLKNKFFISLLCIALVNIFFALSKEVAIYRWVRVLEVLFLYKIIADFISCHAELVPIAESRILMRISASLRIPIPTSRDGMRS